MQTKRSIFDQILALEKRLLAPKVRTSPEKLVQLLSDDFIEFGSSGQAYDKQQAIEALQHGSGEHFSLQDFQVRPLAPGVILATYRAVKFSDKRQDSRYSLRSSIWKFEEDRWQMVFHQGTPVDG
ncbi:MAG: DUF4440 domain-containing protein [Anaerolineales bacterium]|jgi:hypothetical protein